MSKLYLLLLVLFSILVIFAYLFLRWFLHYAYPKLSNMHSQDSIEDHETQNLSHGILEPPPRPDGHHWMASVQRLDLTIFFISLFIYLATHFIGLQRFPITFFADEAANTAIAASLVDNGFRYNGEFLPTYFLNVDKYSLSITVYIQVIPYLLFGKSIIVTRSTSVLVSLAGVIAVSLALRQFFRIPYWWSGILLLALSPAWFMHSRTAFESPIATSLFAIFLYSYFLYLYRSPKYFSLVLITMALTFYSYNPARVIIVASVTMLFLSDFRYHWKNRGMILRYWWLLLLCLLPYLRFQIAHPFSGFDQLYLLNSYWIQDLALSEKMLHLGYQFTRGLSPFYWYIPHEQDLIRHVMKGYGHLLWITSPFFVTGLIVALKHMRISAYRVLLIALLCAPLGGAMVETTITRSLPLLVPITLLTAIGLSTLIGKLTQSHKRYIALSIALLSILSSVSLYMTQDALKNGATWYKDYGLYGMQYGSPEIFEEINAFVDRSPSVRVIASPYWANGTSMLARFFMDDLDQLRWGVIDDILAENYPISEEDIFMMLPHEYERAKVSNKIKEISILKIIDYPDGRPGFTFARIDLVDHHSD